jgi:glycosyltransferase involved in cell wall biosynthesis
LFRATFITPHQAEIAGGVYAIQQWATQLARWMHVNLLVLRAEPHPLPGVNVQHSADLAPASVPDADVILLYINAPPNLDFFSLPASKGEKMLLHQASRENETIRARLRLGLRVVCPSKWLTEEARRSGSRATCVPNGIDTEIFFRGTPAGERPPVVSMMCHNLDWKGTDDGIAALDIVRKARPATEFKLFGRTEPEFPAEFHPHLSQREVGEILRASAVFVCPSWVEGFGMPGLEALACGTALATTDTNGSRDYALDGETALVSPPREPEALAENVLRLLDDRELRGRLGADGAEFAHSHFHPWPQAAEAMRRALVDSSG